MKVSKALIGLKGKKGVLEWEIDYEAIIVAHLAQRPTRVLPGSRFAIPMSEQEWWAFPRMPGWKYEYANKVGALTEIRPFGPHYRIVVEPRAADAPCEIRSVKRKDARALRRAFSEAFFSYIDYIYSTKKQVADLGSRLLRSFFWHGSEELCWKKHIMGFRPEDEDATATERRPDG